jgi:hypothetical protein
MRTLIAFLGLVATLATQTPSNRKDKPKPSPYLSPEGYEVYAELLPMDWTWKAENSELLVIQKETEMAEMEKTPGDSCSPGERMTKPWTEAWDDYKQENISQHILANDISIRKRYVLKSAEEIKKSFATPVKVPTKWSGTGWEGFHAAFPEANGYIILSAVGFSIDKTKAIAYMGHHCGILCGSGQLYFLEKKDKKWVTAGGEDGPDMSCVQSVS